MYFLKFLTMDIFCIYVTEFGTISGRLEPQINSMTMISTAVKVHI